MQPVVEVVALDPLWVEFECPLAQLSACDLGATVTPELLAERGLVHQGRPVKVLGNGEITAAVKISAHTFSQAARATIEAAGGSCEEIA